MKINPCILGQWTKQDSHCKGYENIEEFSDFMGKRLLKQIQNPA